MLRKCFFKHWTKCLKNNSIGFQKYRYIEYMTYHLLLMKLGRKEKESVFKAKN